MRVPLGKRLFGCLLKCWLYLAAADAAHCSLLRWPVVTHRVVAVQMCPLILLHVICVMLRSAAQHCTSAELSDPVSYAGFNTP